MVNWHHRHPADGIVVILGVLLLRWFLGPKLLIQLNQVINLLHYTYTVIKFLPTVIQQLVNIVMRTVWIEMLQMHSPCVYLMRHLHLEVIFCLSHVQLGAAIIYICNKI